MSWDLRTRMTSLASQLGCKGRAVCERVLAGGALLALAPLLALIGLAVMLTSGRPALFPQARVGRDGTVFRLRKFRTMRAHHGGPAITAHGDIRVTRIGRLLRNYKLDELPQLWNILAGDMQFVGPRPEVPSMVDLQAPLWANVLAVRPGLADLATLIYRDEETRLAHSDDCEQSYRHEILPAKLSLSVAYQQRRTLASDCQLLLVTFIYSLFPNCFNEQALRRIFLQGTSSDDRTVLHPISPTFDR